MGKTLSKTLCLLAAALMLMPSAYAGVPSRLVSRDAPTPAYRTKVAKETKDAKGWDVVPTKANSNKAAAQFYTAPRGVVNPPRVNAPRYAGSSAKMMGILSCSDVRSVGTYNISTNGDFELVSSACNSGYSAVIDGDYYRVCNLLYAYYWTEISIDYFNMANDWSLESIPQSDTNLIALAMDRDPNSGLVYGCFYNATCTAYEYATIDFSSLTKNVIATLSTKWVAFGFDANGQAYAIDSNGKLQKVDKFTGATTYIGDTGYVPYYVGNGCVDPKNNKMYWSVSTQAEKDYLLAVDLSNANVEVICEGAGEIGGLVMLDRYESNAPAAPQDFTMTFVDGSLSGTCAFKAPTTTYGGQVSSGNLNYELYANGILLTSGTTTYGGQVNIPVTMTSAGNYQFSVVLSNSNGRSPNASASMFVGKDTPQTPTVTATYNETAGQFLVSWNPIKLGVNEGYVDLANLTYKVVRYPDEYVVAEATTQTSIKDAVAIPDNLVVYHYTVQAQYGDVVSAAGVSNNVPLGAIAPPYVETFDDSSVLSAYTILDENVDEVKWTHYPDQKNMRIKYSQDLEMDDWLISPGVACEAGKAYYISADFKCQKSSFPEKVEMFIGKSTDVDDMTVTLLPKTTIDNTDYTTLGNYFVPETTGTYYIGIHGCSDPDMFYLYVDNISVGAGISAGAPGPVTEAKVTPGLNGALTADIEFITPKVDFSNKSISSLTKVEILRGDEVVKTFNSSMVSTRLTYQDTPSKEGDYTYTIVAYNEDGAGNPVTLSTYVGVNYPGKVENVKVQEEEEGNVTISWDALAVDQAGYPLDPSLIKYNVRDYMTTNGDILEANVSGTSYNYDAAESGQVFTCYGISGVTSRGEGKVTASDMVPVGAPYTIPYFESFAGCVVNSLIATYDNVVGTAAWKLKYDSSVDGLSSYDGDNGYAYCEASTEGAQAYLFTGKISLEGATKPELRFATFNVGDPYDLDVDENTITVQVREGSGKWTNIFCETIYDIAGQVNEDCWAVAHVDLSDYVGKVVQFRFVAANTMYAATLLDAIQVKESLNYDLQATAIEAPAKAKIDESFDVNVNVLNDGAMLVSGSAYTVSLYRNGELVSTQKGTTLASGASKAFTFSQKLNVTNEERNTFYAVVNYERDLDTSNNTSDQVAVALTLNKLNLPTGLSATLNDDETSVTVKWTAAEDLPASSTVTDDFEDGAEGDDFYGDWTFLDVDGKVVGSASGITIPGIDSGYGTASFVICNPEACGITNAYAFSGDQCLISSFPYDGSSLVDDWAITPELSGEAQTVSLWARSYTSDYPQTIELLYSTTDTETSSFISVAKYKTISKEWTEYTADLPAGAKYFAIRNCDTNAYFLFVDGVTYKVGTAEGERAPIGYNVYRDGVKINTSLVRDTQYVDEHPGQGTHTYHVSAVFGKGESKAEGPVSVDVTRVGALKAAFSVVAENRTIVISNAADARVEITTLDGKVLYTGKGDAKVAVKDGVYMVTVGKTTSKLMVK